MRRRLPAVLVLSVIAAASSAQERAPATRPGAIPASQRPPTPAAHDAGVSVYFSPDGGAADATVYWICRATRTLDVAAYSVTHVDIARALVAAHRRGVKVRVVLDTAQAAGRYSSATFLSNAGIDTRTDTASGLMHHKYVIVDGAVLLTGSFNLTKGGDETNQENLLVIEGKPQLVAAFARNFAEQVLPKSKPYVRPATPE